ncbi:hypothetical protein ACOSP7_023234 [Xanthoceras sorbifolium]
MALSIDAEEIVQLCSSLSLTDVDGPIVQIADEVHREGIREVFHCLVGKVLSRKCINREAFKGVIEQLWSIIGKVDIEIVGANIFVFYFQNVEDRGTVWARGPWHFDGSLIVLEKPLGPGDLTQ